MKKKAAKKKKVAADEVELIIQEGVKQAVELAQENGINLDFSDASIEEVEKLLDECHREYKKAKSEDGFHGLALMFGAYIGEVIRRKGFGGTWASDHPEFGENSFPFNWRDQELFLYGWCLKRIFDGDGDNVAFKYHVMVVDPLKKAAGKRPKK